MIIQRKKIDISIKIIDIFDLMIIILITRKKRMNVNMHIIT